MEIIKGHAYDITKLDKAINRNGDEHTQIRCWCMDKNSFPFLLIFDNFPHTCKLELPTIVESGGRILEWNMDNAREVFNSMCRVLKKKEIDPPSGWKFLKLTRLYNYSTKKYPYMLLTFNTQDNMNKATRLCKKVFLKDVGQVNLVFRETHIDNYNKMFSLKNLGPTQKFKCSGIEILPDDPNRISKPGPSFRPFKEYIGEWKTLEAIDENWISYPIICSWDIEAYSHNHRCFPQKHCPDDEIFSISATFQHYMKPETKKDYVIIMGFTHPIEDVITINVKTESDVIEKFFEIIEKEDPDVFIGYNIFGFDYGYLDARIKDIGDEWKNIGRLIEEGCDIKNLSWSSDAYGHQNMDILNCPGRISIDMLTQIKRDFKLSMYNLNSVGKFFLGEEKVDLKAIEMFEIHKEMSDLIDYIKKETSESCEFKGLEIMKEKSNEEEMKNINRTIEGNTIICKYNVQDSVLVIRLFEKLSVWISLIELSSIVRVTPMEYFTRGQQVRCVAQIYHEASHKGIVLTQREKDYVFFNGGRVEDPIVGFWPLVICFDFNSLYPSIMIAYNICYTTLLKSLQGIDEKDYHYFKIEQEEPAVVKQPKFDRFDYGQYDEDFDENDEDKNKKVTRTYELGFVKAERKKGLLPTILETLLSNRSRAKKTKKKFNDIMKQLENDIIKPLKNNTDLRFGDIQNKKIVEHMKKAVEGITDESKVLDFKDQINNEFYARNVDYKIYDSRQLGLKISANSLYGYVGAQISGKYPLIEASMAITARGRNLIIESGLFTKKHFNATTVYGDSILGNEPLLLRDQNNKIYIEEIENLGKNWYHYNEFKPEDSNRKEKEQCSSNLWIWSQGKWNKIKRIIRHKTVKDIYRVNTHIGLVDVTEDHSLLSPDLKIIKPKDCIIGKTKLAHSFPHFEEKQPPDIDFLLNFEENLDNINLQKCLLFGFFFGDGSSGSYKYENGFKNSWYLCNQNIKLLEFLLKMCKNVFSDITDFKIINVMKSSSVFRIIPVGNIKSIVNIFSECYTRNKEKKVPNYIINGTFEEKLYFWKGYYLADGSKNKELRISNKGKLGTSQLYYIAKSLGYSCSVSCRNDKENIFRLTCSMKKGKSVFRKETDTVKKMYVLKENYTGYVYDVETEDGHFCAGIGELNIKNTDSIMIHVPEINDDPTKAWEMADIIEKKINGTKDKYDENGKLIQKGEKGIFPPPLNLEFEKAMRALFMKKKHYAYMEYAEDGSIIKEKNSDKEALNVKGIVLARRDNCLWVRETYETMIRGIFAENTIETSFDIIIDAVVEVIELKFNITEKLSIVKSMGSNYKSSTFSLAIFSDLMKKLGRPVQPGERFPYVIVNDHQKREKIGQKMRTNEFFLEEWENAGIDYGEKIPEDYKVPEGLYPPEEIDSVYYITNILSNPIDKLFEKGYARVLEKYQDKKYEPEFNKRLKPVSVVTPLKMISLILKDHKKQIEDHGAKCLIYKLLSLKDWFRK